MAAQTKPKQPKRDPLAVPESKLNGRDPLAVIKAVAPERPCVVIDDEEYELRLLQEFGAADHHKWTQMSARYDELWNQEKLKAAELAKLERLLDELFDMSLVNPGKAREQLGDLLTAVIKREVVLTFTTAPLLLAAQAARTEEETADQSTMES